MVLKIAYIRWILIVEVLSTVVPATDCCSSRLFQFSEPPKNTSPPKNYTPAPEERIMSELDSKMINSIIESNCFPPLDTILCLNRGRCFTYKIANYTRPSCECAEGFMGERCEFKYAASSYSPIRTAKITAAKLCFGAVAASIFSTIFLYYCQNRCSYFIKANFDDG